MHQWQSFLFVSILMCIHQRLICISGYGKTVSHVVIGLKTAKGTKQLKVNIVLNHCTGTCL